MAIPYNSNLNWDIYTTNPDWQLDQPVCVSISRKKQGAINLLFTQTVYQPVSRGVQFVRDLARLVLKVPIRAIMTPIILPKNWKERERCTINAKLTGYSFVHLTFVPAKILITITAIFTSVFSRQSAQWLLVKSKEASAYLDGRAAQLEALKEVGLKNANTYTEYNLYKTWAYGIAPKLCSPPQS